MVHRNDRCLSHLGAMREYALTFGDESEAWDLWLNAVPMKKCSYSSSLCRVDVIRLSKSQSKISLTGQALSHLTSLVVVLWMLVKHADLDLLRSVACRDVSP